MANEKQINSRIQQKHDIEANWITAGNAEKPFIPKVAEIIVYDCDDKYDYERLKIGDGIHNINELSFINNDVINRLQYLENINDYSKGLEFSTIDTNTCEVSRGDFNGDTLIIPMYSPEGKKVVKIAHTGFAESTFTNCILPNTIKEIGAYAFLASDIKEIIIPDSVKTIREYAFESCDELQTIIIGKNVETIENHAFANCAITKIFIPKNVTTIGSGICYNASEDMTIYCEADTAP
jgi:hypothetical protein